MKKDFTMNQIIKSLLILAFAVASNSVMAQYRMIVTNPVVSDDGYNGYKVVLAEFGDQSGAAVTGDVVYVNDGSEEGDGGTVNDGCQEFTGTSGKIAFIDRGSCDFVTKCTNAANDGAIAVVICNNVSGRPDAMTGTTDVTIPCVSAYQRDCDRIKLQIESGVNITLESGTTGPCINAAVDYPENVVWGGEEGQGDFTGGLNGWTVQNDSDTGWVWDATGRLDLGKYFWNGYVTSPTMVSKTGCSGAMVFNSDFYDDALCPTTRDNKCTGSLISPSIDVSSLGGDEVYLQFTQSLRQFDSEYFLYISTDGGENWGDAMTLNEDYDYYQTAEGSIVQVPLCGAGGTSELKVRFEYKGYYYYWAIDDVMILNKTYTDGQISESWFARAPFHQVPVSQVDIVPFLSDIASKGNGTLENAVLNVNVVGPNGDVLYEDSKAYGEIAGCSLDENRPFANTFQVPSELGVYTVSYEINSDNDDNNDNNKVSYQFEVTDNVFNKIPQNADIGGWRPGGDATFYTLGSIYHFPNEANLDKSFRALGTSFNVVTSGDKDFSGYVNVALYKWEGDFNNNGEVNGAGGTDDNEMTKLAYNEVYVSNTEGNFYEVEFEPLFEGSLDFIGGGDYIIAMHVAEGAGDPSYYVSCATSDDSYFNYAATAFTFDTIEVFRKLAVRATGTEGTAEDEDSRTFATGAGLVPRLPFLLADITGTEDINKNLEVSIFPNPVVDVVSVNVNLADVSKKVNVQLVNIEGKVVSNNDFENVKSSTLDVDVTDLTTGVYMVNIRTEEGFIAKKIVIQK